MVTIQISLASEEIDVPSMFVLRESVPKNLLSKYDQGWQLMVAHRPLLGDVESTGDNVYGRHWVAIDKKNTNKEKAIEENTKLNGRMVIPMEKRSLIEASLIGGKYRDKYLAMPEEESFDLLETKIRKLEGLPYSQLLRIKNEVS